MKLPLAMTAGIFLALLGCESRSTDRSETYTLYRDSPVEPGLRLHVATFDANDRDDYNRDMCETVREFFTERPFMGARYWCEAGRYRENPN
jgi:hypothetical protein